jgi:hypothetical protein
VGYFNGFSSFLGLFVLGYLFDNALNFTWPCSPISGFTSIQCNQPIHVIGIELFDCVMEGETICSP